MKKTFIAITAAAMLASSGAWADERANEIATYELRMQRLMEAKVETAHECFWDRQYQLCASSLPDEDIVARCFKRPLGHACSGALVNESDAEKGFHMLHVETPFADDEKAEIHDYVMRIANMGTKDFDHPVYTEKDYEAMK